MNTTRTTQRPMVDAQLALEIQRRKRENIVLRHILEMLQTQ